jgi:hypothetical protein
MLLELELVLLAAVVAAGLAVPVAGTLVVGRLMDVVLVS